MKTVFKQKEFENKALLIFLWLGIQFRLICHENGLETEEFENEALLMFLQLGIQFTLIRHENSLQTEGI